MFSLCPIPPPSCASQLIALDEDASTGVTDSMTCPIGVHTLEGDIMGMDGIPWLPNQQGLIQPAPLPVRPGQGLVVVAVVGSVATVVLLLALGRMILLWRQQQVQLKQASAFRQEVARLPASAESVKKEGLAVEALATGKKRRKGRGKVKEKHLEEQAPAVLEGIAPMHGSGSGPPSGPGEARNPSNDTSTAMGGGRSISALVRQRQEEPGGIICIGHMRMDSTEVTPSSPLRVTFNEVEYKAAFPFFDTYRPALSFMLDNLLGLQGFCSISRLALQRGAWQLENGCCIREGRTARCLRDCTWQA